jgi:hypothetical protein
MVGFDLGGFMVRQLGFLVGFLFSIAAFASPSEKCQDLAQDLQAMQSAQRQLLTSLSQKNETMASVLDQSAESLQKNISARKPLKKSDLQSMRMSAKAFRGHEKRETALIQKFEKASSELLDQVQVCLADARSAKN